MVHQRRDVNPSEVPEAPGAERVGKRRASSGLDVGFPEPSRALVRKRG